MKVTVTTHFAEHDTGFIEDYCFVEVAIDGVLKVTYGDHTDRGAEKAAGFVDGVYALNHAIEVEFVSVADEEI